ncbi:hypothetical protein [Photobacterium leiognathi]|uniref:hypothetical protein n=1 Tax=Photobacterium leiognathi TaxID=553611 RepID=UPI002982B4AB|nr:hypothetical protein [Photobacterium leiognathi]
MNLNEFSALLKKVNADIVACKYVDIDDAENVIGCLNRLPQLHDIPLVSELMFYCESEDDWDSGLICVYFGKLELLVDKFLVLSEISSTIPCSTVADISQKMIPRSYTVANFNISVLSAVDKTILHEASTKNGSNVSIINPGYFIKLPSMSADDNNLSSMLSANVQLLYSLAAMSGCCAIEFSETGENPGIES